MKIVCPNSNMGKKERKEKLLINMEKWIRSDAMNHLIDLFGGTILQTDNFKNYMHWINEFAEIWNYRARNSFQNQENERWNVSDDEYVQNNKEEIMRCVLELGLVEETVPSKIPDFILPLGGARYSNLYRAQYANKIYQDIKKNNSEKQMKVIALSGTRPISDKERNEVDTYAFGAKTEFDAICSGLEIAFGLRKEEYEEERNINENINLCSVVRKYKSDDKNTQIISLAAPSSNSERRANSRDTFEYFLDRYHIKRQDNILLVTSQIYVPYQLLKFVDLALEGEFNVECVGYRMDEKGMLSKTSNFLQEVKGTINAINMLVQEKMDVL